MKLKPFAIAIIGLAIVLMTFLHSQYGIFTRYNWFTAQWDKNRSHVKILVYGKELISIKQKEIIAKRLGFELKSIAGCMINRSQANGADCYNQVMKDYLTKKIGKYWQAKFEQGTDSLFRAQSGARICKAVIDDEQVKELIARYDPHKLAHSYVKAIDLADTDAHHPNTELCMQYKTRDYIVGYYKVDPYTLRMMQIWY
jgi:hypothetical protein